MKLLALSILTLTGCDYVWHLPRFEHDAGAGFAYRKTVTVHHDGPSALTDFATSIALDADADLAAHASGATDLVFELPDGTVLDQEIVAYDAATGALDAWVRVPTLAPGTNELELYYAGPAVTTNRPWSDYAGVWHLSEPGIEHDRTSHRHDLSPQVTAPAVAKGLAGLARSFTGTEQLVDVAGGDASFDFGATTSFSYSVWVFATASLDQFDMPLNKGGDANGTPGFDLELGMNGWDASVNDTCSTCVPSEGAQMQLTTETLGRWVFLAVTIDRPAHRMIGYVDGLATSTADVSRLGTVTGTTLTIGGPHPFDGLIDEVQIIGRVLSADEIAAEHANLAARDSFVTVGPELAL